MANQASSLAVYVSDLVRNLILQHAWIDTFVKHYLDCNINVDVQIIYCGIALQQVLMQFACIMSRLINLWLPWRLTPEQLRLVNDLSCIHTLS